MACNGFIPVRCPLAILPLFMMLHPQGSQIPPPIAVLTLLPGGGKPISQNRTLWPVTGGAVGFEPGWFRGHANAFMYINLGDGNVPENYSLIMQPVFEITGPNNDFYNGSVCIPQVPLPANYTAKVGNNATIQVVEAAQHGAALYNVSIPPSSSHLGTFTLLERERSSLVSHLY